MPGLKRIVVIGATSVIAEHCCRLWLQREPADLLLVAGSRLGEMSTQGYSLIDIPRPKQKLIHVHPGGEELPVQRTRGVVLQRMVRLALQEQRHLHAAPRRGADAKQDRIDTGAMAHKREGRVISRKGFTRKPDMTRPAKIARRVPATKMPLNNRHCGICSKISSSFDTPMDKTPIKSPVDVFSGA